MFIRLTGFIFFPFPQVFQTIQGPLKPTHSSFQLTVPRCINLVPFLSQRRGLRALGGWGGGYDVCYFKVSGAGADSSVDKVLTA